MSLTELHAAHAFEPAPRRSSLHRLHVEFDDLTGAPACEAPLLAALSSGQRVALVGSSGSGKTSVTESVLGPLREGVAPIHVPVSPSQAQPSLAGGIGTTVRMVSPGAVDRPCGHARPGW